MKEFIKNYCLFNLFMLGPVAIVAIVYGLFQGVALTIMYFWPHLDPRDVGLVLGLCGVWIILSCGAALIAGESE